eukprot:10376249-Alexandrium_andersonii.AAC.1
MVLSVPEAVRNPPPLRGTCGAWTRVWFHVAVGREVTEPSVIFPQTGWAVAPGAGGAVRAWANVPCACLDNACG